MLEAAAAVAVVGKSMIDDGYAFTNGYGSGHGNECVTAADSSAVGGSLRSVATLASPSIFTAFDGLPSNTRSNSLAITSTTKIQEATTAPIVAANATINKTVGTAATVTTNTMSTRATPMSMPVLTPPPPQPPSMLGTAFTPPDLGNLLCLQLQQLNLQNLMQQAGWWNEANWMESLRQYGQLLELRNNGFAANTTEIAKEGSATNRGADEQANSAPFVEFRARECGFCKSNKETREYYTSHYLKNAEGHVVCPILSRYVCPYCRATGIYAHTKGYCPKKPPAGEMDVGGGYCHPFRNGGGGNNSNGVVDKFAKSGDNGRFRNTCAEMSMTRSGGDLLFKNRVF